MQREYIDSIISTKYLRENPNHIFVFGDNKKGNGKKGAAIHRDEPNSMGFITKKYPSYNNDAYYKPREYKVVFDKELEQVTVRPQDESFGSSPAQLLSGTEPLAKNFYIEELGAHEGYDWLELKPKQHDANFDYIRLALENNEIRAIETLDGLGNTTRLFLSSIKRNPELAADSFKFIPPAGIDVIGEVE